MEGCPKALMINFDLKEPGSVENAFEKPLRDYIQEFYHEDPQSYSNEIQQITQLRKSIANVPRDKQGCTMLRKYYTQLHYLQSRFPMGEGGAAAIPFVWYDVYSGEPVVYKDVRYEQACVLFNLGGLYSQLASNEDRMSDESMRTACTHFQSAAGAFQFLKDHFSLNEMVDMNEDILSLKAAIMLGQALECIMEKSIRDDRNPTLIARIGIQIRDYFKEGIDHLNKPGASEMGSTLKKLWIKHLNIKTSCYEAIAYTYMSNDADQKEKYGEKVTYLKAASEKINEASKLSKNQSDRVVETVQFIMDVVSNKYTAAVKENDFVYHLSVPALSALEEIKGVNFVKPLPFQHDDASVAGTDIFKKLVPMKAHESSSLYSEVKASLLRKVSSEIEEKDLQLSQFMSAMKIEDLLNPKEDSLPDELLAKNIFLKDNPDLISKVEKSIEEITIITSEVESILKGINESLESEKTYEEKDLPEELQSMISEFDQLKDAHEKASKTNNELIKHSSESKGMIQFLSGDPKSILQTLPSQNVIDAPSDEPVVQRIREILAKVDKMRSQRQYLLDKLREELNKDDITTKIVVRDSGNNEAFFEEEIKKHDETTNLISQNLTAQENITQALTEQNAKYATTRQQAGIISAKFDTQVKSYLTVVALFLEVKDRLSGGLGFYKQLNDNVKALKEKVTKYCAGKQKKRLPKNEAKKGPPARPTARKPNIMMNPSKPADLITNFPVNPNQMPAQLPTLPHNQSSAPYQGPRMVNPQSPQLRMNMMQEPFGQPRLPQPLPGNTSPSLRQPPLPGQRFPNPQAMAAHQPNLRMPTSVQGYDGRSQQPQPNSMRQSEPQRFHGPMNPLNSAQPTSVDGNRSNMTSSQNYPQSPVHQMQQPFTNPRFPQDQISLRQQIQPRQPQFPSQQTPVHSRLPQQIFRPPHQASPNSVSQLPQSVQHTPQLPQQPIKQFSLQPSNQTLNQPRQQLPQQQQQMQPRMHPSGQQHMHPRQQMPQQGQPRPQFLQQQQIQPRPQFPQQQQQQQPRHVFPTQQPQSQPFSQQQQQLFTQQQQLHSDKQLQHQQNMQLQQQPPLQPTQQFLPRKPVEPQEFRQQPLQPQQQYSRNLDSQLFFQQQMPIRQPLQPQQNLIAPHQPVLPQAQLQQPWKQSHQQSDPQQQATPSQKQFHQQPINSGSQSFFNKVPINDSLLPNGHKLPVPLMPEKPGNQKPQTESVNPELSPVLPRSMGNSFPLQIENGNLMISQGSAGRNAGATSIHHTSSYQMLPNMFAYPSQSFQRDVTSQPTMSVGTHGDVYSELITPRQTVVGQSNSAVPSGFVGINQSRVTPTAPNVPAVPLLNEFTVQSGNITQQPTRPPMMTPQVPTQQGPNNLPFNYQNVPTPYAGPIVTSAPSGLLFTAKPTMSPSSDPVISNILGKPVDPVDKVQYPELAQIGFQQFQLQQYLLQQQQVITMLQNQQNLQRSEEDTKIHTLQNQIVEQQKLIEDLVKEHKGLIKEHNYQEFQQNLDKIKKSEYQKSKQEEQQNYILEQQQIIMNLLRQSEHLPPSPSTTHFPNTLGQLSDEKRDKNIIVVNPLVREENATTTTSSITTKDVIKNINPSSVSNLPTLSTLSQQTLPMQTASLTTIKSNLVSTVSSTELSDTNTSFDMVSKNDTNRCIHGPIVSTSPNLLSLEATNLNASVQLPSRVGTMTENVPGESLSGHDPFYEPKIDSIDNEELMLIFPRNEEEGKREVDLVSNKKLNSVDSLSSDNSDLILPRSDEASKNISPKGNADEVDQNIPERGNIFRGENIPALDSKFCEVEKKNEKAIEQVGKAIVEDETGLAHDDIDKILPRSAENKKPAEMRQTIPKVIDVSRNDEPAISASKDGPTSPLPDDILLGENNAVDNKSESGEAVATTDKDEPICASGTENTEQKALPETDPSNKQDATKVIDTSYRSENEQDKSTDRSNQNTPSPTSSSSPIALISPSIPAYVASRIAGAKSPPGRKISAKSTPNIARKISARSSPVIARKTSSKSSPNVSNLSSPNLSARSSPIRQQSVQLDDVDNKERSLSTLIDHRHLARQLGRLSFYVSEPDEIVWRSYIKELKVSVNKLREECKNLCKPVDNENEDGFGLIWKDLAKVETLDVRNFTSCGGESNISKNRYRDILPWDHTSVKITSLPNDYINASFIEDLTPLSPRYIATQGPIPQCFEDFWTMIWEQKSSIIVMLTNEIEGHKLKCHPYWRREIDTPIEYGNMVVILMDETVSSAWKIRTFTILNKKGDDTRIVKQLQFTSWPDYGTPETPYELLAFTEEVYEYYQKYDPSFAYPIVLHCSAGVGRTGSFCCIYSAIREIEGQNNLIQIPGVVRKLRQCRPHMVQRKEQLIFCYQAILCFAQQFVSTENMKLETTRQQSFQSSSSLDTGDDSLFLSATSQQLLNIKNAQRVEPLSKVEPPVEVGGDAKLPNLPELPNYPSLGIIPCTPPSAKLTAESNNETTDFDFKDADDFSQGSGASAPKFKINSEIFHSPRTTGSEPAQENVPEK